MDRRQLLIGAGVFLAGCSSSDETGGEEDDTYLEILNHEATDEWVIEGRAENVSDQALETAMVLARFTDKMGGVLKTRGDVVTALSSGERWRFIIEGGSRRLPIAGYYLETEAVPE